MHIHLHYKPVPTKGDCSHHNVNGALSPVAHDLGALVGVHACVGMHCAHVQFTCVPLRGYKTKSPCACALCLNMCALQQAGSIPNTVKSHMIKV